jgi:hydroxymethylpyrimidine/phosphomethylpyrimidine kinase
VGFLTFFPEPAMPKSQSNYVRALTIAGSDNSGGAGIQADLKTFSALGCYGMSVITALTAQNTQGVSGIQDIPPAFVAQQINTILEDVNVPVIEQVAECLRKIDGTPIVLDPVMFAKSGDHLLQEDAVSALRRELLPHATVLTPNVDEAAALLDCVVDSPEAMEQAARDLCALGPHVVVKGGNLTGNNSDDCLCIGGESIHWLKQERIDTHNVHGTGCTFSSAIAAHLAKSLSVEEAVRQAKDYLTGALKAGAELKLGKGKGPVLHFHQTWKL